MSQSDSPERVDERGALKPSFLSYHWPFVWAVTMSIWAVGIFKRGATFDIWLALAAATLGLGYMFFIDISHSVWWTADQIWWRGWDYLSIKPMRHAVRIDELTKVVTATHPGNYVQGKPFDRFLLVSPTDTIIILPSFHRREELEALLRFIQTKRPEVISDPQVIEFMDGGFTDWWRYR